VSRPGASSAAKWPPRVNSVQRTTGRLEAVGQDTCILHTGSNSLEELALYVAVKGFGFQVLDPPELIPVLRSLADRLRDATEPVSYERSWDTS
jgi:hypothetical protein